MRSWARSRRGREGRVGRPRVPEGGQGADHGYPDDARDRQAAERDGAPLLTVPAPLDLIQIRGWRTRLHDAPQVVAELGLLRRIHDRDSVLSRYLRNVASAREL